MKTIHTCFPGGKHKALSLSYDDGQVADRKMVEALNRAELKGTFHLNAAHFGWEGFVAAEEVASLYASHEVASHSFTHPIFERCPREQVALQVLEDRKRLEDLTGYAVRGFSYPYGSWSRGIAALLPSLGIEYARLVDTSRNFHLSDDLFAWKPTCHHNDDLLGRARRFRDLSEKVMLSWFSVWGHSFEFDRNDNWDLLNSFCELVGGRDDVWYATVISVTDYLKAAGGVRVALSGAFAENPSAQSVWLSVDDRVMEIKGGATVPLG